MQKEYFELLNELGQANFEAAKKLGELNVKFGEKLVQNQVELTTKVMEAGAKSAETLGKAKGFQDVISGQSQASHEVNAKLLDGYKTYVEVLTEARKEYGKLFEDGVKLAEANLNKATEATKKKAA